MTNAEKYQKLIPLLKELLELNPNKGAVIWLKLQFILQTLGEIE